MKSKNLIFLTITILLGLSCSQNKSKDEISYDSSTNDNVITIDIKKYFDSCDVEGSIAIYDINEQKWTISDTAKIKVETLPASTFKIVNLLIALETKTIDDENEKIKWVGSQDTIKYGYRPNIYHDMSAKEAFKLSAGWAYVELARKIGKEKYKEYLTKCNYGNNNLTQKELDFWNFGDFGISPKNQVEFLHSLYKNELPFSKQNIDIVKNVMITEKAEGYTIRAKTGWTRESNTNIGWWAGYIETKKGTYIFATRLIQDRKINRSDFGSCRKEITKKVFKDLGIIEQNASR